MRPPRLCMTTEEICRAGREDGAADAPLTDEERIRLVALLGPYIRASLAKRAVQRSNAA
ncbi:hypothetical protein [Acrocarpospora phusangensis]|uniref:hypothetical protein n=1 Tax=Acrocarpospora phusangensis TaxID=1070424 RepID=UPI0019511872|nr:hypothetical protein [Acrocarpospora phusangensis]